MEGAVRSMILILLIWPCRYHIKRGIEEAGMEAAVISIPLNVTTSPHLYTRQPPWSYWWYSLLKSKALSCQHNLTVIHKAEVLASLQLQNNTFPNFTRQYQCQAFLDLLQLIFSLWIRQVCINQWVQMQEGPMGGRGWGMARQGKMRQVPVLPQNPSHDLKT